MPPKIVLYHDGKVQIMDDPLIGAVLGDYEIQDGIGRGGMGVVYCGRQLSLDRLVAIKVLPSEFCTDHGYVNRFLLEARAAAHLNHPNIIQIFDAGVANDIYFFVMEYMDGSNLGQLVRERGCLDEREALYIIQEAAKGLAFAHSKGIIHRDVKPENIMITNQGAIKICDLGLAKWKSTKDALTLTADGASMGTPYYVSPEQIRGAKDIDARADIYSMGIPLDHLFRGKPAFSGDTAAEVMAQHLSDEIPPLRHSNPRITQSTLELLTAMTAKDRDDRLQHMTEAVDAITRILAGQPPALPRRLPPSSRLAGFQRTGRRGENTNRNRSGSGVRRMAGLLTSSPLTGRFLVTACAVAGLVFTLIFSGIWPKKAEVVPAEASESQPVASSVITTPALSPPVSAFGNDTQVKLHEADIIQTFAINLDPEEPKEKQPAKSSRKGKSEMGDAFLPLVKHINFMVSHLPKLDRKSSGLVRMSFQKIKGMDTVDGFQKTIQECEKAALVLTPLLLGQNSTNLKVQVRRIRKSWGDNFPQEDPPLDIPRIFEELHRIRKSNDVKITFKGMPIWFQTLLRERQDPIVSYFNRIDDETNWLWASKSENRRWQKEGADGPEDCDPEPLSSVEYPKQNSFDMSEGLMRPVHLNILPDLQAHARAMVVEGRFIPHSGWIIQQAGGMGNVIFGCAGYKDGPCLILERHGDSNHP